MKAEKGKEIREEMIKNMNDVYIFFNYGKLK